MYVTVSTTALSIIRDHVVKTAHEEACGLLLGWAPAENTGREILPRKGRGTAAEGGGGGGRPQAEHLRQSPSTSFAGPPPPAGEELERAHIAIAVACRNVAADPARRFEIDPAQLLATHRAARAGGPAVLGHYHSHPGGSPLPSPRDAADAPPDGALWLIVGAGDARLWRAVAHGQVEGRFDPVACPSLSCTQNAGVPQDAAYKRMP